MHSETGGEWVVVAGVVLAFAGGVLLTVSIPGALMLLAGGGLMAWAGYYSERLARSR